MLRSMLIFAMHPTDIPKLEFTPETALEEVLNNSSHKEVCETALRLELIHAITPKIRKTESFTEDEQFQMEFLGMLDPFPLKFEERNFIFCWLFYKEGRFFVAINPLPLDKDDAITHCRPNFRKLHISELFNSGFGNYFEAFGRRNAFNFVNNFWGEINGEIMKKATQEGLDVGKVELTQPPQAVRGKISVTLIGCGRAGYLALLAAAKLRSLHAYGEIKAINMINEGAQYFMSQDGLDQINKILKQNLCVEIETPNVETFVDENLSDESYKNHGLVALKPTYGTKIVLHNFHSPWLARIRSCTKDLWSRESIITPDCFNYTLEDLATAAALYR